MKKVYVTLMAVLAIIAAFNFNSIRTSAKSLPKGAVFTGDEDNELFVFRVIKPCKGNKLGEVEVVGLNPSPSHEHSRYELECLTLEAFDDEFGAPYEIVGIADNAFKGNTNIRSFYVVGTELRYIGKGAFEGCTNLRKFSTNRDDLTVIKDRAFAGCKSLCRFAQDDNKIKKIGKDAFKDTGAVLKIDLFAGSKYAKKMQKLYKNAGANRVVFKLYYYDKKKGYYRQRF